MTDLNITFFSSDFLDGSSLFHRCILIGEFLKTKKRIDYTIISERPIKRNAGEKIIPDMSSYIKAIKSFNDVIVIHRSSSFLTYFMTKVNQLKNIPIIYDFDDVLFQNFSLSTSHIRGIIRSSDAVSAGSHFLLDFSKLLNTNSYLIPTSVNTDIFNPRYKKNTPNDHITIGWLGPGTDHQLPHLRVLKKPLKTLNNKYDIKFRIVSGFSNKLIKEFKEIGIPVDFGLDHWVPLEETPKLISDFDIGVMPLTDTVFSRGKCSMKALEYMAMEIPPVVTDIGENRYVIDNNQNGFLAKNGEDWIKYLSILIEDDNLRKRIGGNGRATVERNYSVSVISEKLLDIINNLVAG